jgi:hypothetical protein
MVYLPLLSILLTAIFTFQSEKMISHLHLSWLLFLWALFGLSLAGCATKVGDKFRVPVGELALHDSIPKTESLAKLELHLDVARNEGMPFLAPHHYQEASDILEDVKRSSRKDTMSYEFAKADVLLDKGEAVIDTVKDHLGSELDLKRKLENLKADEIYPWQYKANINTLSKLIKKIELGKAGNIERDKQGLKENMQQLYDKTVEYTATHGTHPGDRNAMEK